jgi:hypothetical protein
MKTLTVVIIALGILALVSNAAMADIVYIFDAGTSYATLTLNTSTDTVTISDMHNMPDIYPRTGAMTDPDHDFWYTEGYDYLDPWIGIIDYWGWPPTPMEDWYLGLEIGFQIKYDYYLNGILREPLSPNAQLIETAIGDFDLSGYGPTQYDLLAALYAAGEGTEVIGDITWEYSALGEAGVNHTNWNGYDYFIGLGSGLGGNGPLGGVPEPATVVGLGAGILLMLRRTRKH